MLTKNPFIKFNSFLILVNDLKSFVYVYNNKGNFLQKVRLGEGYFSNSKFRLKLLEILLISGLQSKFYLNVQLMYFSFLILFLATYISFVHYAQFWSVEMHNKFIVKRKFSPVIFTFQSEVKHLLLNLKYNT